MLQNKFIGIDRYLFKQRNAKILHSLYAEWNGFLTLFEIYQMNKRGIKKK
jgi:hypothetical protein